MRFGKWVLAGMVVSSSMMAASVEYVETPFAAQNFGGRIQDAKGKPVEGKVALIECSEFHSANPKKLSEMDTDKFGGFQFAYQKGMHCLRVEAKGFRTTAVKLDVTSNTANRAAFIPLKPGK